MMEEAFKKGISLAPGDVRDMAKAYRLCWLAQGVAGEPFLLTRARELYEQAVEFMNTHIGEESEIDLELLLGYCRVLQFLKENEAASGVILTILSHSEHDPQHSAYLLYAGDIFKTLGRHEKAASYLFEAMQLGPPRMFTKLEMMFLMSRNIEEGSKEKDEACDNAYDMVCGKQHIEWHISHSI